MPSRLLLDANLTVLLAVGLADRDYIAKHKNLSAYDMADFDIVTQIVNKSSGIIFTPNVLTETSNLIRQVRDPIKTHVSQSLALLISRTDEVYIGSRIAAAHEDYNRLGLTDSVILILLVSGGVLLTADLDLYLTASRAGLEAINYNHIRDQRPDFRQG